LTKPEGPADSRSAAVEKSLRARVDSAAAASEWIWYSPATDGSSWYLFFRCIVVSPGSFVALLFCRRTRARNAPTHGRCCACGCVRVCMSVRVRVRVRVRERARLVTVAIHARVCARAAARRRADPRTPTSQTCHRSRKRRIAPTRPHPPTL
jgi:hypothetical protein